MISMYSYLVFLGGNMRIIAVVILVLGIVVLAAPIADSQRSFGPPDDDDFIVIVFKDGRQQRFEMSDITRIEFKSSGFTAGRGRFLGRWSVGTGTGETFFIILTPDGEARRSNGNARGTWAVSNGEARISWDDGWHDVIRRVGSGYEKAAFSPGRSFEDRPANVTAAVKTESRAY
jgi:hypothetical protein